jgi:hypothetical protein
MTNSLEHGEHETGDLTEELLLLCIESKVRRVVEIMSLVVNGHDDGHAGVLTLNKHGSLVNIAN